MNNKHRISVVALVALLATVLAAGCDSEEGGPSDLGMTDGMIDTIAPDSAGPDSAAPDSAAPDSAAPDSATPDSAGPDSAMLDSALSDSSSTSCTPEGQSHAVVPSAPPCCPGLQSVGCDAPDLSGQCQGCAGATYCTKCGDGICGPGENKCRCPADCPSCTPEGQSHAVVPGAPPCCPGLKSVGCDAPDSSGQCQGCAGATYCTDCGDGICGPSENKCRCPADCP